MAATPPDPIVAVMARLRSEAQQLPPTDGVSRFNHLYLAVTLAVDSTTQGRGFQDPPFVSALDVMFAGLYFSQLDASAAGHSLTRSWAPLFAARSRPDIAPIQFALAGMNAHINHDLCLALVATFAARGLELSRGTTQYQDYEKVNGVLAIVEQQVKQEFLTGLIGVADSVLGRIDNVIAMWNIVEARNAAWASAEMLWALRGHTELTAGFEDALDGTVGFAGRGLLIPTLV